MIFQGDFILYVLDLNIKALGFVLTFCRKKNEWMNHEWICVECAFSCYMNDVLKFWYTKKSQEIFSLNKTDDFIVRVSEVSIYWQVT